MDAYAWIEPLSCVQLIAELQARGLCPAANTMKEALRNQLRGVLDQPGTVMCTACNKEFSVVCASAAQYGVLSVRWQRLKGADTLDVKCPGCQTVIRIAGG